MRTDPAASSAQRRGVALTRRTLLVAGGAAVGYLLGWRRTGGTSETVPELEPDAYPQLPLGPAPGESGEAFSGILLEAIDHIGVSPSLGLDYLSSTSHGLRERSLERVSEAIRDSLDWSRSGVPVTVGDLTQLLRERIRADFREDRICYLDSWYLSLTECRLAAAKYLKQTPPAAVSPTPRIDLTQLPEAQIRTVEAWGPVTTTRNTPFNPQPDGSSAFWMRARGADSAIAVVLGDVELKTTTSDSMVTADLSRELESEFLDRPGSYPLHLVNKEREVKQKVGDFVVTE